VKLAPHRCENQLRHRLSSRVPEWERGRKDVYRLKPDGEVTTSLQFRDFAGTFMEHCHNTTHEDNAMLLRWDIDPDLHDVSVCLLKQYHELRCRISG
jgi:FtsP/CotA-like multicopper oxidase with cupredoxin domain